MPDLISSKLSQDLKNSWRTDPKIFNTLNKEFNFLLDVASTDENSLCRYNLNWKQDGTTTDWFDYVNSKIENVNHHSFAAWCNPPYGRRQIEPFVTQAIAMTKRNITTVMLVPNTIEAGWVDLDNTSEIRLITGGRINFYHPITNKKVKGNTKGSMLMIFRPNSTPLFIRTMDRAALLG